MAKTKTISLDQVKNALKEVKDLFEERDKLTLAINQKTKEAKESHRLKIERLREEIKKLQEETAVAVEKAVAAEKQRLDDVIGRLQEYDELVQMMQEAGLLAKKRIARAGVVRTGKYEIPENENKFGFIRKSSNVLIAVGQKDGKLYHNTLKGTAKMTEKEIAAWKGEQFRNWEVGDLNHFRAASFSKICEGVSFKYENCYKQLISQGWKDVR